MQKRSSAALLALVLLMTTCEASEPAFMPLFMQIKTEYKNIKEKRAEIASNFEKMRDLSAKNALLEDQVSQILQELSKSPEFGYEVLISKAKAEQVDEASATAMEKGYNNINKEIEKTWTISK